MNIPKRGIRRGRGGNRNAPSKNRREILDSVSEQEGKLESAIHQLCMFLGIPDQEIGDLDDRELIIFFRRDIDDTYGQMLDDLKHR